MAGWKSTIFNRRHVFSQTSRPWLIVSLVLAVNKNGIRTFDLPRRRGRKCDETEKTVSDTTCFEASKSYNDFAYLYWRFGHYRSMYLCIVKCQDVFSTHGIALILWSFWRCMLLEEPSRSGWCKILCKARFPRTSRSTHSFTCKLMYYTLVAPSIMHLRCEILTPEMFSLVCAVFVRRFADIEDRIGMIFARGEVWRYSLGFDVAQWPTHSAAEAGISRESVLRH